MWWKNDTVFCKSRFFFLFLFFLFSFDTIRSVCCWETWKGEISSSNGAVFFGMPLLKRRLNNNYSKTISRSPCQRLGKHFKGKPFESNLHSMTFLSQCVHVKLRAEELKIVFLHWCWCAVVVITTESESAAASEPLNDLTTSLCGVHKRAQDQKKLCSVLLQ